VLFETAILQWQFQLAAERLRRAMAERPLSEPGTQRQKGQWCTMFS